MTSRRILALAITLALSVSAFHSSPAFAWPDDNPVVAFGTTWNGMTGPDGSCYNVTNNNTANGETGVYVPQNSLAEWHSFLSNPPNGVSVVPCGQQSEQSQSQNNGNLNCNSGLVDFDDFQINFGALANGQSATLTYVDNNENLPNGPGLNQYHHIYGFFSQHGSYSGFNLTATCNNGALNFSGPSTLAAGNLICVPNLCMLSGSAGDGTFQIVTYAYFWADTAGINSSALVNYGCAQGIASTCYSYGNSSNPAIFVSVPVDPNGGGANNAGNTSSF